MSNPNKFKFNLFKQRQLKDDCADYFKSKTS